MEDQEAKGWQHEHVCSGGGRGCEGQTVVVIKVKVLVEAKPRVTVAGTSIGGDKDGSSYILSILYSGGRI